MKKGFTLIEMLAIIVIIAVIMTIVVPTVTTLINDRKEDALLLSAKSILKQVESTEMFNKTFVSVRLSDVALSDVSLNDYDLENSYVYIHENEFKINLVGKKRFENLYVCEAKQSSKIEAVQKNPCGPLP